MWDPVTWLNFGCWGVCFWWMHRLSARQERMLIELQAQAKRLERLSKAEHDLLRELHPAVEEMQSDIEDVASAVIGERAR